MRAARRATDEVIGASEAATILLEAVEDASPSAMAIRPGAARRHRHALLEALGRSVYAIADDFMAAMYILGATIRGAQMKSAAAMRVNLAAIVNQIDRMGVGAVPVVVLMSTIIGAIVAQQGAFQLRYFGAEISSSTSSASWCCARSACS